MKKITLLLPSLLLALGSISAFGQTCTAPTAITSGQNFNGTTIGADTTIGSVCGGISVTGPVAVYTWTNAGGSVSGNITVTPSNGTFDVALALGDGATCAAALGTCDGTADADVGGAAESIALTGLTNKTFYLFVTSFASGAANVTSGPFAAAIGTLPVKLQSFNVN